MTISEILKEFDESLIGSWTEKEIIKEYLRQKMTGLLESTKLEKSQGRPIQMPCPDNQPGCLVLHYSSENYLQDWDTGFNKAVSDQEEKIKEALA